MNQESNQDSALPQDNTPTQPGEQEQPAKKRHPVRQAMLSGLVVLVLSALGILYGQRLVDMVKAATFRPSQEVAAAAGRLDFSPRGHDVFYSTSPVIQNKQEFNTSCQSQERTAAILGCYYRDNIYLYNIQNKDLDGTLEVTAAHEMLHAAYQRLNYFERQRVDQMILAQYDKVKTNPDLVEIMKYYSQAEPGAEVNELHSILGTTLPTLDPELEQYYAQYFKDRQKIVGLNTAYNKVFGSIKSQSAILEAKIKAEEPRIQADLASYNSDRQQLELDITSFNQRAASGSFTTMSTFNATRSALLARASTLNARRDDLNQRVEAYNNDVMALNALSVQVNELYKSINGVEGPSSV